MTMDRILLQPVNVLSDPKAHCVQIANTLKERDPLSGKLRSN